MFVLVAQPTHSRIVPTFPLYFLSESPKMHVWAKTNKCVMITFVTKHTLHIMRKSFLECSHNAFVEWIQPSGGPNTPFLARKSFVLPSGKTVSRATVFSVGLGYYKLFLDGNKVSDHELGAFTTYEKRVYYDTWDVTALIRQGETHTLGIVAMCISSGVC